MFDRDIQTAEGDLNLLVKSDTSQADGVQKRISPLYEIVDVMVKSPLDKVGHTNRTLPMTDLHVDIYAPEMDDHPVGFCNFGDRTIAMTSPTRNGPRYIDTSFRKSRDI